MSGFDKHGKVMGGALGFTFNAMRNTAKQKAAVGRPIPFGERPADRPFADQLGNGRCFAGSDRHQGSKSGGALKEGEVQPTYGLSRPADPTHFRKRSGLRTFSWEQ